MMIAALWNRDWDEVKSLLDRPDTDVRQADEHGRTVAHWAAWYGELEVLQRLLDNPHQFSLDVNAVDRRGRTVAHLAVANCQVHVLSYLLMNAARLKLDVHSKTKDGRTLPHLAAYTGHLTIVQYLVHNVGEFGLKPDFQSVNPYGNNCALDAAAEGHVFVVAHLVGNAERLGLDVNAREHGGRTMMHQAALGGHWDVLTYLLHHADLLRLDLHAQDHSGRTPFSSRRTPDTILRDVNAIIDDRYQRAQSLANKFAQDSDHWQRVMLHLPNDLKGVSKGVDDCIRRGAGDVRGSVSDSRATPVADEAVPMESSWTKFSSLVAYISRPFKAPTRLIASKSVRYDYSHVLSIDGVCASIAGFVGKTYHTQATGVAGWFLISSSNAANQYQRPTRETLLDGHNLWKWENRSKLASLPPSLRS